MSERNKTCFKLKRFASRDDAIGEALKKSRASGAMQVYRCMNCDGFHVGAPPPVTTNSGADKTNKSSRQRRYERRVVARREDSGHNQRSSTD